MEFAVTVEERDGVESGALQIRDGFLFGAEKFAVDYGVPLGGDIIDQRKLGHGDGRAILACGGQRQCGANVECLGLAVSEFVCGQVEAIDDGAQHRRVLEDLMEACLRGRICGDDDRRNARAEAVELEADASGLAGRNDFVGGDGDIAL